MSLAAGLASPAKFRTVLVKVSPAPATLSERRAVLHVLKRHGQVDVFKKLHDPSHFISVVASPEMASGLVERSPLEFDYVGQQPRGGTSRPSPPPKTFLVKIVEKPDYTHRTHIRESLIYGRWPEREDVYHLFSDHALSKNLLSQAVPPGMAHAGLVDWESFDQLDDEEKLSASLTSKTDFVRARERRRKSESKLYSLVQAYNARLAGSEQAQEGGGLLRAAEPMDDAADLQDNPLARVNSTEEESLKPAVRDAS